MKHDVPSRRRPTPNAIQMEENFQVRYWMQRLSVSRNALGLAVQAVGNDADDVERFIRRARGRCSIDAKHKTFPLPTATASRWRGQGGTCVLSRPEELLRLHYVSRAAAELAPGAVQDLLAWSIAFNARAGITGALIATGTHFSQVLEGPASAVEPLMASIARDPRHRDVRMLYESTTAARRFDRGSMVLVDDAGLQPLIEELWWATRIDSVRATRLLQHLLYRLRWEPASDDVAGRTGA